MTRSVLAIGIDPAFSDPAALGGFTPDMVRAYIDAQIEALRAQGYEAQSCLIDLGETAEAVVSRALASKPYDCVVIGAGLREPRERLLLFEAVLNLVHVHAPASRIAFNTTPADTLAAVERWTGPASAR